MNTPSEDMAGQTAARMAGKYLTVVLDHESYGIAVSSVREIIRMQKVIPIPQAPDYVKGVINLRGGIIAVIDLRTRFGMRAEFSEQTCIVVVHIESAPGAKPLHMGLIVDTVEEVLDVTTAMIEPTPELGGAVDISSFLGIVKVGDRVKTLLNLDRVFARDSLRSLVPAAA